MSETVLAILGSGALSSAITGGFALLTARKRRKDGVHKGVCIILYDRIKYLGRKYISENEVSQNDLEDLTIMHNIYHNDLGGNGYLDDLMVRVKNLPPTKGDL